MKYLFTVALFVLHLFGFEQSENYDVRSVRWGMTKDEVVKIEGNDPVETASDRVRYSDVDMGRFSVNVSYSFSSNQLNKVDIAISSTKGLASSRSFDALEAVLKQRYGNASEVTNIWATAEKKLRSDSSAAISAGALARNSTRINARTSVYHTLYGRNGNTIHQIIYKPREATKAKLENLSKF